MIGLFPSVYWPAVSTIHRTIVTLAVSLMILPAVSCSRRSRPAAAVALSAAPSTPKTQPTTQPSPLRITHGPYLQAPSESAVTITWATDRKCVSKVEYSESSDGPWITAQSSHDGLIDAYDVLHSVRLTGLKPGTTYHYRVVSTEMLVFQAYKVVYGEAAASGYRSFVTLHAGKPAFSFLVLNDRHEKVPKLRESLAAATWHGVDMVFLNGDLFNHLESEQQIYSKLVDPCVEFFAARIPMVFVRGNHETRGVFARSLHRYFSFGDPHYYTMFEHGGVCFLVLDGGEDKADTDKEYHGLVDFSRYLEIQTRWLQTVTQMPAFREARFRVVLVHIPPLHAGDARHNRDKYLQENWGPILDKGNVDLVLSGHTHKYAEHAPGGAHGNFHLLVGGTETTIRADVTANQMTLTTTNADGSARSAPIVIRRR